MFTHASNTFVIEHLAAVELDEPAPSFSPHSPTSFCDGSVRAGMGAYDPGGYEKLKGDDWRVTCLLGAGFPVGPLWIVLEKLTFITVTSRTVI